MAEGLRDLQIKEARREELHEADDMAVDEGDGGAAREGPGIHRRRRSVKELRGALALAKQGTPRAPQAVTPAVSPAALPKPQLARLALASAAATHLSHAALERRRSRESTAQASEAVKPKVTVRV